MKKGLLRRNLLVAAGDPFVFAENGGYAASVGLSL